MRTSTCRGAPARKSTTLTGTSPHGQGHQTVWATLASEELVDRDAKLLAGEHRPHGLVALAVAGGPGENGGGAVRVHLDGAVLVRAACFRRPGW